MIGTEIFVTVGTKEKKGHSITALLKTIYCDLAFASGVGKSPDLPNPLEITWWVGPNHTLYTIIRFNSYSNSYLVDHHQ
jgi:hypothetical protein